MKKLVIAIAMCMLVSACSTTEPADPIEAPAETSADSLEEAGQNKQSALSEQTKQRYKLTDGMVEGVEFVREIKPEEWNDVQGKCMDTQGFPERAEGGWEIPEGQEQSYGLAQYTCMVQYPLAEIYNKTYGEAEHLRYYEYWRDTVLPCLKSEGYATNDLPSFEVFTSTAGTESEYYPVAEALESPSWDQATETCKVLPTADYILGLTNEP